MKSLLKKGIFPVHVLVDQIKYKKKWLKFILIAIRLQVYFLQEFP